MSRTKKDPYDRVPGKTWVLGISLAQRNTIKRIRAPHIGHTHTGSGVGDGGTDGWTIYRMPSTGEATYLELRHHIHLGVTARWVIERDGRISAWNDEGQRRSLIAYQDPEDR